jgi:hypothetical protein
VDAEAGQSDPTKLSSADRSVRLRADPCSCTSPRFLSSTSASARWETLNPSRSATNPELKQSGMTAGSRPSWRLFRDIADRRAATRTWLRATMGSTQRGSPPARTLGDKSEPRGVIDPAVIIGFLLPVQRDKPSNRRQVPGLRRAGTKISSFVYYPPRSDDPTLVAVLAWEPHGDSQSLRNVVNSSRTDRSTGVHGGPVQSASHGNVFGLAGLGELRYLACPRFRTTSGSACSAP